VFGEVEAGKSAFQQTWHPEMLEKKHVSLW
jgi:hypothetical protein